MNEFQITQTNIEPENLKKLLLEAKAGAYVSFEGWVRNHHQGRQVHSLMYEACESLCAKEAQIIWEETRRRFPILVAQGRHRVGQLAVGDVAVWIGVIAPHRDEAFAACRYLIDTIKHRLPIWKKEFYVDGTSGWVRCESCESPHQDQGNRDASDHDHIVPSTISSCSSGNHYH
jgi:molybdopterin synthase catalytic subunit